MADNNKDKVQESTILRGVCASIQSMSFPSFDNLIKLMKDNGYIVKIDKVGSENSIH